MSLSAAIQSTAGDEIARKHHSRGCVLSSLDISIPNHTNCPWVGFRTFHTVSVVGGTAGETSASVFLASA